MLCYNIIGAAASTSTNHYQPQKETAKLSLIAHRLLTLFHYPPPPPLELVDKGRRVIEHWLHLPPYCRSNTIMLVPLTYLDIMELSSIVLLKHSQTCSPDPTPLALAINGSTKSTSTYRCLSLLFSLGLGTDRHRNRAPQGEVFYPFFYPLVLHCSKL